MFSAVLLTNSSLGSGKSTLLKAILGELKITQGSISAPGIIAYCDQLPWLWNTTVDENITGPHERDEIWLQRVLWACGLDQDMQHMSKGSTVGEGGSSLSGGQKNRVSLARAVYSRAKLVLLDDILSGLDSRTELLVFSRVFGPYGLLKANGCTIALATNSKRWFSYADSIIILEKGHDTLQGTPSELGEKLGIVSVSEKVLRIDTTILLADSAAALINPLPTETKSPVSRLRPDSEVYSQYFKSFGFYYTALYFALLALYVGSIQMQSVWLKWWAAAETMAGSKLIVQASVFTAISCIAILLSISLFGYSLLSLLARSSLHLHVRQWEALMKVTYVAWITQSIGGVINRFSQDVMIINTQLANAFINTAMQLRTLDLEAKAPLCAHFLQSASGLASIKAFGWSENYREKNIQLLRNSQVPYYLLGSVQNWLALVLNLVVAGLATAVVSIAFNLKDLDTGYLGLALTGIMDIGFHFEILIQSWTSLETSLGAVARMNQFVNELPQEAEGQIAPSTSWPERGEINIQNLTASYSIDPAASSVLKDISLHIKAGEKVAICGRTGSGKSSIVSAIFGLLRTTSGTITIDDLDTTSVRASALRAGIMLLTQDPYFVNGSIRQNLLLHRASGVADDTIVSALERTGLSVKLGLHKGESSVSDILDNLLVPEDMLTRGETQLFAITRAILSTSQILILDEPTSGLDAASDQIVQRVLWEHCAAGNRTMICIAHKLRSIIDYDVVVVVNEGRIVEKGKPSELARTEGSLFGQLLSQSS
ncbi:P-loop containing nucleoside triphosphate hydrolase protein [Aureobasidium pullulans]|uniref:P-loop containing nucleoside triphosphate hydrolase protein n=1 Tax=Aureobasidium pullulans TaxID=5580 RepID=A0AB74JT08_AURPU|nr:P-loop containing nucleoside triphosphate hydrolase protein [Aureobasidium pullulans]THX51021.1 P-loop containing nucleoside triphosphate hydrolase protein [Aureobasidium pullulans]